MFFSFLEGGREWTIFVEEKKNIFTSSPPPRPFSKVGKDEKNWWQMSKAVKKKNWKRKSMASVIFALGKFPLTRGFCQFLFEENQFQSKFW